MVAGPSERQRAVKMGPCGWDLRKVPDPRTEVNHGIFKLFQELQKNENPGFFDFFRLVSSSRCVFRTEKKALHLLQSTVFDLDAVEALFGPLSAPCFLADFFEILKKGQDLLKMPKII